MRKKNTYVYVTPGGRILPKIQDGTIRIRAEFADILREIDAQTAKGFFRNATKPYNTVIHPVRRYAFNFLSFGDLDRFCDMGYGIHWVPEATYYPDQKFQIQIRFHAMIELWGGLTEEQQFLLRHELYDRLKRLCNSQRMAKALYDSDVCGQNISCETRGYPKAEAFVASFSFTFNED
jgi:hypothetical protein